MRGQRRTEFIPLIRYVRELIVESRLQPLTPGPSPASGEGSQAS